MWRLGPLGIAAALSVFLGALAGAALAGVAVLVCRYGFGIETVYWTWWLWCWLGVSGLLMAHWTVAILRHEPM
jgi:hypothetical protein